MTEDRKRLDTDERGVLGKSEILLVDRDTAARELISAQVEGAGMIVTAIDDSNRALFLAREKYFQVIVIDADTPDTGGGIDQIPRYASASPASAVMLVCREESFDCAAQGFRHGAADVACKAGLDDLVRRIVELCLESRRKSARDALLKETLELHDLFLRRLMEEYRRAEAAEDSTAQQSEVTGPCVLLVVDDNPRTAPGLQQALGQETAYRCVAVLTGGEALDHGGSESFDMVLVNASLPDLPGSMVARTLCAQMKDSIVILFEHPGAKPGFASIVERDRTIELVQELTKATQLIDGVRGLNEAYATKKREKRYLQGFRRDHSDFLRQFVELRKRIQQLLPDESK